jgi:hypothetical protein
MEKKSRRLALPVQEGQDSELLCREVSYTVSLKGFQKECFESFPPFHRLWQQIKSNFKQIQISEGKKVFLKIIFSSART